MLADVALRARQTKASTSERMYGLKSDIRLIVEKWKNDGINTHNQAPSETEKPPKRLLIPFYILV